jgi:hypothetical protein
VTTPPTRWRDSAMSIAWTVFAVALLLYVSVRLIVAVLPVLLIIGGVVLAGCAGWSIYQFRRSRW